MFDLLNFNIGGSGFGGDRTLAGGSLSSPVTGIAHAALPRSQPSAWRRVAKKFLSIFDVASFDPYELAHEIWETSDDATKTNVYALVDALVERALINLDNGTVFTKAEVDITQDLDTIRRIVQNG